MKRPLFFLSAVTISLLVPSISAAADYRPSQQVLFYASQDHSMATQNLSQAKAELEELLNRRAQQEKEYANSFAALLKISEQISTEKAEMQEWIEKQIREENALLEAIRVTGAPHNVLKIRSRQRKLRNAKALFAEQRDVLMETISEKEMEWQSQWNALQESQEITRAKFNSQETVLRNTIDALEFDVGNIDAMRKTGRAENALQQVRAERIATRKEASRKRKERRASVVAKALEDAEQENYFTRANPEVVAQMQEEMQEKIDFEQSMQRKELIERLGITGPINEKLRASLFLHLFGTGIAEEETTEEVSAQ